MPEKESLYSRQKIADYILRHWRGECSLKWSLLLPPLWIALIGLICGTIITGLTHSSMISVLILALYGVAVVALVPWWLVGVWRSSGRYLKTGKVFLAFMARTACVLIIFKFLVLLALLASARH